MSIRVGVGLGVWPFAEYDPGLLWRYVERSEELGLDSIWFTDRLVSTGPFAGVMLEPLTTMAAVAARTSRLKFGPAVLALSVRNPVVVAKEIATIDFLSGGRMLPAFGLGLEDEREYEAAGVPKAQRGARVDEAVVVMRRLWSETNVTHHGRFFHLSDVTIEPRPVQKSVPVWFGGRTEAAFRRVGRLGDGWVASFVTPAEVADGVRQIKEYAAQSDRELEEDHYGVLLSYYIAGSAAEALAAVAGRMVRRRADAPVEEYSAFGTPDDCIRMIRRYIDAGAAKFVLRPVCRPDEMFEQLELLGREVAAPVHALQERVGA